MFMLIILLTLWRLSDTEADDPDLGIPECCRDFCLTLNKDVITAETGRSAVIHCSFSTPSYFYLSSLAWYKCNDRNCDDPHRIFDSRDQKRIEEKSFSGRVSLLEPDLNRRNCSIIITDLRLSDSGRYFLKLNKFYLNNFSFTFNKVTISVKALQQEHRVTEGTDAPATGSLLSALIVFLILNVVFVVVIVILVLNMRTMKLNHEVRVMSLQRRETSSDYEVMTPPKS